MQTNPSSTCKILWSIRPSLEYIRWSLTSVKSKSISCRRVFHNRAPALLSAHPIRRLLYGGSLPSARGRKA
jgi:hypothetical protein